MQAHHQRRRRAHVAPAAPRIAMCRGERAAALCALSAISGSAPRPQQHRQPHRRRRLLDSDLYIITAVAATPTPKRWAISPHSTTAVVPWSSTVRSGCRQLVLYSQPLGTLALSCCYGPSLSLPLLLPYSLLGFQGLPGPPRSCWPVRALHMLPLVRLLLVTLQLLYSFYYSYSTLQLLYSRSAASTTASTAVQPLLILQLQDLLR